MGDADSEAVEQDLSPRRRVVGVLPDVPAVDRVLDYTVDDRWTDRVAVGTVVRIPLQGRRVRGWIWDIDRIPAPGVTLRAITKLSGIGPSAELLSLAEWAAHRWAGRRHVFLRAATPPQVVSSLPPVPAVAPVAAGSAAATGDAEALAETALSQRPDGVSVLRWAPASERVGFARAALRRGPALLLAPSQLDADALTRALRAAGHRVARHPDDWAAGATGATVIGSRAAVWAPVRDLACVVVFDEHDERFQDERTPTWNARDVAVERARRARVPVLLISPVPSLEALESGPLLAPPRSTERAGWPLTTIVDRRELDPRQGLYSAPVIDVLRSGRRVVVLHNRTGRAKLLACSRCGELCRCAHCGAAMTAVTNAVGDRQLQCASQRDHVRPEVCSACGATRLSVLRPGVGRVREELQALVGAPVVEVAATRRAAAADQAAEIPPDARIWVGTEAVLHRVRSTDVVVVLDLDQDLLAPRFRAGERTLAMLALASRMVGGRRRDGRLLLQTRQPDHEVVQAVLHGDPGRWSDVEAGRRRELSLPPFAALALVDGPGAADFAAALTEAAVVAPTGSIAVQGPSEGRYLVRAADSSRLADALAAVPRPTARLRITVDPPNI